MESALPVLSLDELSEEAFRVVCTEFVKEDLSYTKCLAFIRVVLLPVVKNLQTPASRVLFAALSHCARIHPKPVLFGLLLPLSELPNVGNFLIVKVVFISAQSLDLV